MKISIIMPVYNPPVERLSACLASVRDQSFSDWELILVNDGGDDEQVLNTLNEAAASDSRIDVIHQENGGPSSARNLGILRATGAYVTYLDSDDELTPYALEEAVGILDAEGSHLLIGYLQRVDNSVEKVSRESHSFRNLSDPEVQSLLEFTIAPSGGDDLSLKRADGTEVKIGPTCRFVRIEFAKSCLFEQDLRIGEDSVWNLDLLKEVETVTICDSIWYWYWISHESTSRRYRRDAPMQALSLMEAIDNRLSNSGSQAIDERLFLRWMNEVVRVSKDCYSRPENQMPYREQVRATRKLFKSRETPRRVVISVVLTYGTTTFVKYLLCSTGIAPVFWSLEAVLTGKARNVAASLMRGLRFGR